jgi:hypothetical protein
MRKATLKYFIAANAAVFAMVAAPAALDHFYGTDLGWMPVANAADDGGGGGKSADRSGGHNKPDGAGGVSSRPAPGALPPAKGKTEPWDPESKPRWMNDGSAGGSTTSSKGGKPIWGQDGLVNPATGTSAELGRMNVSRAPAAVFDRQLAEAFTAIIDDPKILDFYKLTVDQIKALNLDDVARLDSPLVNLALLKDYLVDGKVEVKNADGVVVYTLDSTNAPALEAILLGSASDKTIPITQDTVYAIYKIITKAEPTADLTAIATEAEAVRVEILYDHDN